MTTPTSTSPGTESNPVAKPYAPAAASQMLAYDYEAFHGGPGCNCQVQLPYLICTACKVIVHLDLLQCPRIDPLDARRQRNG